MKEVHLCLASPSPAQLIGGVDLPVASFSGFWGGGGLGELGEDFALCRQNLHPDLLKPPQKSQETHEGHNEEQL